MAIFLLRSICPSSTIFSVSDPVFSICSYLSNIFENYFTHLHHLQPGDSSPGRLSTARWQRWHHLDSLASWKVQVKVHTISFWFTLNYDKFFTESCKIVFHYFLWIHIITALTEFLIWNEKYLKYFSDLWWQTLLWSGDCVDSTLLSGSQVWIFSVVVLGVELIMVSCVTGAHWSLVSSYTWPRSEQRWETQHCTQHCHGWTIRDDKWIVGSSVHWSCSDQQTWSYWTNKSWDNWSDLLTLILTNSTRHHHGQLDHKTLMKLFTL